MGKKTTSYVKSKDFQKYFFWSANSEHYQDAFLCWLFFNAGNDDQLGDFSRFFIGQLIKAKNSIVEILKVERQVFDSDIDLIVKTQDNEEHLIIIENKTGSAIHPSKGNKGERDYDTQLEKYFCKFYESKEYKKYFTDNCFHLVFFKNESVEYDEIDKIKGCDDSIRKILIKDGNREYDDKSPIWNIFDIETIIGCFNSFPEINKLENTILNDYYGNLNRWYKQYKNIEKIDNNSLLTKPDDFEEYWDEKSWLWRALLWKMSDESSQTEEISKYNGNYWGLYHHRSDKFAMSITSRDLINALSHKKLGICINLKAVKYNKGNGFDSYNWKSLLERDNAFTSIRDDLQKYSATIKGAVIKTVNTKYKGHYANKMIDYQFELKECTYGEILGCYKEVKKIYDEVCEMYKKSNR